MAQIIGKFDGYTYAGDWIRVDASAIHWSSKVNGPSGMLCGTPSGTLRHRDETEEQLDSAVRMAIEISIRDSIGMEREEEG